MNFSVGLLAQQKSKTWNPNIANGKYRNPIIDADYSDPDVCRVGNDYYMTSSSFACFPGLQILHSTDLVNWEIIGTALTNDYPLLPENIGSNLDWHMKIQSGNYVFAPSIRYHDGWFYIFCGDPDQGIFMTKTQNPRDKWDEIVWVQKGKGFIDCCPLWDDDGRAYLSHACAGSGKTYVSLMTAMKITQSLKALNSINTMDIIISSLLLVVSKTVGK